MAVNAELVGFLKDQLNAARLEANEAARLEQLAKERHRQAKQKLEKIRKALKRAEQGK